MRTPSRHAGPIALPVMFAFGCGGVIEAASAGGDGGARDVRQPDVIPPRDSAPDAVSRMLVTLAKDNGCVFSIAVDTANVYWSCGGKMGSIMKVPIDGGAATQLATSPQPQYLAVDGTNVYWSEDPSPAAEIGILSVPVGGGTPTTLAYEGSGIIQGISVGGGRVFWLDFEAGIFDVPIGGGTVENLVSERSKNGNVFTYENLATDSSAIYWVGRESQVGARRTSYYVKGLPLAGGHEETIVSGIQLMAPDASAYASALAVNKTGIYWGYSQAIQGRLTSEGLVRTIEHAGPRSLEGMTVDEASVYWLQDGNVLKAPLAGGSAPTTLATGQTAGAIAVDATSVYWGTYDSSPPYTGGAIMKLTPK
jgi:hypothetical protein